METKEVDEKKSLKVNLWLRVERNNKFVRGKKRAREEIEMFVLSRYSMKKLDKDSWEYELTIPYSSDEDLDETIYDMLDEMATTADLRNCFIEYDLRALDDSDRSW